MKFLEHMSQLEALYGQPSEAARIKVAPRLTPAYRSWIERSRFCVLATVGQDGTDSSPRGDDGPVVRVIDDRTLALPDWRGNQRLDSLRNIVADGRCSLMFFVPGSNNVIRVNGHARLTDDARLRGSFARGTLLPTTVAVIGIGEVYSQCARALMRSRFWAAGNEAEGLPGVGEILAEISDGRFGGAGYDRDWSQRAKGTMW